jgi:peptide/nickel transport system substrate-binding protein
MSFSYSSRVDPYLSYESMLGDKSKRKVWHNPKALALLEAAGNSGDTAVRQGLFDQLHELMLKDTPLVVLFCPADVVAINRKLTGFRPWAIGRERLWNVRRADPVALSGSLKGSMPNSATLSDLRGNTR